MESWENPDCFWENPKKQGKNNVTSLSLNIQHFPWNVLSSPRCSGQSWLTSDYSPVVIPICLSMSLYTLLMWLSMCPEYKLADALNKVGYYMRLWSPHLSAPFPRSQCIQSSKQRITSFYFGQHCLTLNSNSFKALTIHLIIVFIKFHSFEHLHLFPCW